MSSSPPDTETAARDGSKLCLVCGICCQGALHRGARIADGEIETVQRLGLTVTASEEGSVFPLPCPLHRENRCTVYAERPSVCRAYQCKLLQRFLAGEATWDDCVRRVDLAKDLMARMRRRAGAAAADASLWERIRALKPAQLDADAADRELLMDAAALLSLCQQHFLNRAQPKEILGP